MSGRRLGLALAGLTALAVALTAYGAVGSGGTLDPRSATPGGSLALARLLAARGVTVAVSHRPVAPAATTTVVPSLTGLDGAALQRLLGTAGTVLLVGAPAPGAGPVGRAPDRLRAPDCGLPEARSAGTVRLGGQTYPAGAGTGCYPAPGGVTLLVLPTPAGGRLVLLGDATPLRNDALARAGDAALAVGLLDRYPRVRWILDPVGPAGRRSVWSLLPLGVRTAVLGLLLAAGLLAASRGRRLGPPVLEPLPVRVPAAETVLGWARLYRAARARDSAAEALRAATRRRLAAALRLGPDPQREAVLGEVAARLRTGPAELADLLYGPAAGQPPPDDASLVRLARDLDDLDRQVRLS